MDLKNYIRQKLLALDQQKDMAELNLRGKFSFGMSSADYGHLPAWKDLVKKKKQMVKMVWLTVFAEAFLIMSIFTDVFDRFSENWILALVYGLVVTGLIGLMHLIWSFYSLFYYFRQTEREVRKLIYQDLLQRLEKETELNRVA